METLSRNREALYAELRGQIGKTKLVEHEINAGQNNRILVKRELDNPFGSHYDRPYLELFEEFEKTGKIKEGDKVFETSTGTAGASFAGIGTKLGFECFTAIPAGGEKAREDAIRKYLDSDHIFFTSAEKYVDGFPEFIKEFLAKNKMAFLNHSMGRKGTINQTTLKGFKGIADEIISEQIPIDYFISAIGNGSTLLGIGKPLVDFSGDTRVIGFEPFQSATTFDKMFPGEYEKLYGIKPGSLSRHAMPGLSSKTSFDFPHIETSLEEKLLSGVYLISDINQAEEYAKRTGREENLDLACWDDTELGQVAEYGRSTRGALAAVKKIIADKGIKDKTFLTIAYDSSSRYDK